MYQLINEKHYIELKKLFSYIKELPKRNSRYENIFNDDEFTGCYILTVSDNGNDGYSPDNSESGEIIEALTENNFISLIDDPDNLNSENAHNIAYYLIDDYDYLLNFYFSSYVP
jgi:hypothetical protein